ncbi:hypothetical protein SH1V18_11190 [Vallitalea longa]|uniref:Uncharacterized protein n=1 Tax=Vallitalea longa TaxID=2936439 RepID=A0A9W6DFF3_9FIRM|nr:hypothetical protein [Vallitalea longa]GKX28639.1 hypothetical protein SH1V18_11190 [Vallitalea longa]
MKRTGIAILICLYFVGGLIIFFFRYIERDLQEFEQLRLSYAVDYASDAAIWELLNSRDLSMDYSDFNYLSADPNLALDTFIDVFSANYGMNFDKNNLDHIKMNFIPVFVVAMYDGYYMATLKVVSNNLNYPENGISNADWDLKFGPKMPYIYKNNATYALNMSGESALKIEEDEKTKEPWLTKIEGLPVGIKSKKANLSEINKIISANISYTINQINETNTKWANTFYIPSSLTTYSGVNPIEGPSVIALVQNVDLATTKPISSFSVAGSKLEKSRMVAGYTREGIKYYCYVDNLPSSIKAENLFPNVKEAAKEGYYYDVRYMD